MRIPFPASRLVLALVLAAAFSATATRAGAQSTASPGACVSVTGPDSGAVAPVRAPSVVQRDTTHVALRILASATADEVRFIGSPRVCVRLTGDMQLDSVRVTARRNLASPVVSSTTYRNVYVAVEILGRLNAECIAGRITGAGVDSSAAPCASSGVSGAAGRRP